MNVITRRAANVVSAKFTANPMGAVDVAMFDVERLRGCKRGFALNYYNRNDGPQALSRLAWSVTRVYVRGLEIAAPVTTGMDKLFGNGSQRLMTEGTRTPAGHTFKFPGLVPNLVAGAPAAFAAGGVRADALSDGLTGHSPSRSALCARLGAHIGAWGAAIISQLSLTANVLLKSVLMLPILIVALLWSLPEFFGEPPLALSSDAALGLLPPEAARALDEVFRVLGAR